MLSWEQIVQLHEGDHVYRNDGLRFEVVGDLRGRWLGWGHFGYPHETQFDLAIRSEHGWTRLTPSNAYNFMTESEFIRRNGIQTLLPRAKKRTLENPRPNGNPARRRFPQEDVGPEGPQYDIESSLARHEYAITPHLIRSCPYCWRKDHDFHTREEWQQHYEGHAGVLPKDHRGPFDHFNIFARR